MCVTDGAFPGAAGGHGEAAVGHTPGLLELRGARLGSQQEV